MTKTRRQITAMSGLLLFMFIWELLARSGLVPNALIPPPSSIPATLARELQSGIWVRMILNSLRHYGLGLLLGSLFGIAAGILVSLSPRFEALQSWLMRVIRPIPPLAWIPFAIIWFGITHTAAAFIISIGVFWINYFSTSGAIRSTDPDLIEVAAVFGHNGFRARLIKVILPAASPGILTGLRTGIGQAWLTVVAAELFGIPGIGQRMVEASGLLATEVVMLYMLTIALLYGLSDVLFSFVERKILTWRPS